MLLPLRRRGLQQESVLEMMEHSIVSSPAKIKQLMRLYRNMKNKSKHIEILRKMDSQLTLSFQPHYGPGSTQLPTEIGTGNLPGGQPAGK
jgi:DNA-binding transcriptional regulator YbjK